MFLPIPRPGLLGPNAQIPRRRRPYRNKFVLLSFKSAGWPLCRIRSCIARGLLLHLVLEVLARNEVRDLVIVRLLLTLLHILVALRQLAERRERVGPKLIEDAGNELRKLLILTVAVDSECVRRDGGMDLGASLLAPFSLKQYGSWHVGVRTLRGGKVDDVAVGLEHVHLLNGLNRLHIQLLERLLQLLIVAARPGRGPLNLSPGSALATVHHMLECC